MDTFQRMLILGTIVLLLLTIEILGAFPKNKNPIISISREDVLSSSFTGGDSNSEILNDVQDVKVLKIAGKEVISVLSRNNLYVIDRDKFSPLFGGKIPYTQIYSWSTEKKAKEMCTMKGQSQENCDNYLRVLEPIDQDGKKLLLCGTNSYDPMCKYIHASENSQGVTLAADKEDFSGKEKCAFGPDQTGVNLYTDGALYSATSSEFNGRSYTITRNLGDIKQLKTPRHDPNFLNAPQFVKMTNDGSRVLIFMNEIAQSKNGDIRMVAYVAQVCKNDVGGQHVLVKQWTKFVKTRLNCSMNGFYFDQLRDISDPVQVRVGPGVNDTDAVVFATFTTPDNSVPGSAVCSFSLNAIHNALTGRFRDENNEGGTNPSAPTGTQHPGLCPSEKYSQSQLQFLKTHPILEDQARGTLLATYVSDAEQWEAIAVDPAAGPQKNWTMYFVGTSDGHLVRYLAPSADLKSSVHLSKQDVFDPQQCSGEIVSEDDKKIIRVIVDSTRNNIMVAFKHCIRSIPLRSCSIHKCRESCFASADPYCGWDGTSCVVNDIPSDRVAQYIYENALNPSTNVEDLCPTLVVIVPEEEADNDSDFGTTITNQEEKDNNGTGVAAKPPVVAPGKKGEGGDSDLGSSHTEKQESSAMLEDGYLKWTIVAGICVGVAILFLLLGICLARCCSKCVSGDDKEKQSHGISDSRVSMGTPRTLCKKAQSFLASVSPSRRRKPSVANSEKYHSNTTISHDEMGSPLMKTQSVSNNYVDIPDGKFNSIQRNGETHSGSKSSRMHSVGSQSQVVMSTTGSVQFNTNGKPRRASHSVQSPSNSSMGPKHGVPNYATAPRPRHPSGNRSSDPGTGARMGALHEDYAATMRVDGKKSGHKPSRHSTPVFAIPPSPCRSDVTGHSAFSFKAMSEVVENTEDALRGVEEVIAEQQRRSREMETVPEDPDERPRHDSDDSGKGSSPRDSIQNDEERANTISSLPRPGNLELGHRGRRQRLNSEPTSPTCHQQAPLAPPSSHKPVGRSNSVRSTSYQPQPSHQQQFQNHFQHRSGSFSSQPSTPVNHGHSPPRSNMAPQMSQQPGNYSTMPTKPNGMRPMDHHQFAIQQSHYDNFSPYPGRQQHQAYDTSVLTPGQQQVMMMPDKYSSLPIRGQGHRSKKNQMAPPPQQQPFILQQPPQHHRQRKGSTTPKKQHPPPLKHQWSSPAGLYEPQQRPMYVTPPTVPTNNGYPRAVPEVNEV